MKYLSTITLLIAFAQFGLSQNACDNWNSIKEKSESDFTDIKRLKIYWSKRCACEQGNITGGTWDYTVSLVNDNYNMYHERRNKFPDQYNYSGSIVPDRKISVGECDNSHNAGYNSSGSTQCKTNTFTKQQDPQNFGNDYMLARCQCQEGVPYEEQAKNLETAMQVNLQSMQQHYGNTLGVPVPPMRWEDCYNVRLGQDPTVSPGTPKKMDQWAAYKYDLINDNAQGLIHDLAAESNNPAIKQLSKDFKTLDNTNKSIANYNAFFNITPSQRDAEFQQVMNNAGQIIAVSKAIVNFFKEEEPKNVPWTQEQLIGKASMKSLKEKMRFLADEEVRIPNKEFHGAEGINELNELEGRYYSYDIATAIERWMLVKYFYSRHRYTPYELEKLHKELKAEGTEAVLRKIENFQQQANLSNFEFAANADIRRQRRINLIKIKKASCYKEIGDEAYAQELLSEIKIGQDLSSYLYDLENNNLFNGEYSSADANYQLLKMEVYKESDELKKFKKSRIVKLLAIGLSQKEPYETISEIESELDFIKKYAESSYVRDASLYKDECNLYITTLDALLSLKKGHKQDALDKINQVTELSMEVASEAGVSSWVQFVKFKVLVGLNQYDEAIKLYDKQMHYLNSNWSPDFYFNVDDLRFMKCKLLFNNSEYDRALKGLDIVETSTGKTDRITMLRAQIYNAKGETEKAKELLDY